MRRTVLSLGLAVVVWATACTAPEAPGPAGRDPGRPDVPEAPAAAGPAGPRAEQTAAESRPEIVFLGDSLTAGLGLDPDESFPSIIQDRLDATSRPFSVVNAGVSGDTSAGGLRRLDWALRGDVRVLVVALGGNDGLRGLPPEELKKNLAAIIEGAQGAGAAVVLAGMEAPPNNGPDYTSRFRQVYPALAQQYDVPLIPFLLDGVAGEPTLNQADGIHPNEEGARRVADTVWRTLQPVLDRATGAR